MDFSEGSKDKETKGRFSHRARSGAVEAADELGFGGEALAGP